MIASAYTGCAFIGEQLASIYQDLRHGAQLETSDASSIKFNDVPRISNNQPHAQGFTAAQLSIIHRAALFRDGRRQLRIPPRAVRDAKVQHDVTVPELRPSLRQRAAATGSDAQGPISAQPRAAIPSAQPKAVGS